MALTSMETKFCKLPLDFGALLSEDVENSRLASCTEIESIDQFIEMLIDTAPGAFVQCLLAFFRSLLFQQGFQFLAGEFT